jgi:hypothetical protein
MIGSGSFMSNGRLHKSTKTWKDIDRRINISIMKLSIKINLTLCDIPSKVWNRMCNIIIWHGQNRKLSNGSISSLDSSCSFVNSRKISIHISWIRSSSGDFFSGSRDLFKSIGVLRHVGQDD